MIRGFRNLFEHIAEDPQAGAWVIRPTCFRCVLVFLAAVPLAAGCTSKATELPRELPRKQAANVRFDVEGPEPIPEEQYIVRSRDLGRPLSPESVVDGMYRPSETTSAKQLHGPHPELVLDLKENEVAPNEDQGAAYFDAASGKVTWPAYTCMNAKCNAQGKDGRPFLFVRKLRDIKVESDGGVTIGPAGGRKLLSAPKCPACNSNEWAGAYEPPEVAERRVLLEAELAASRAARREAKNSGTTLSPSHRTPMAIMYDLSALPKLYLVPDE
ncbi:MAG: hypothetical protein MI757_20545 [Pirellulales bacterium]|nr:hypothetical protein [Pirellulales bacterium]